MGTGATDDLRSSTEEHAAEHRDGMRILWDVAVPMDDGVVLRADVFLPEPPGTYPTLLSYGPYAKGLAFQEGYPTAWRTLSEEHPDVVAGSTNAYQNWEVVDPEKWTIHDYAIVRVDSRGCGRSPGRIDHFSRRETRDFHDCIEWAAAQPWSTGDIGLSGVSYFAMNQWLVAATQPPHLRALCIWEGAADFYRDASHHGGILSTFWQHWYDKQIKSVQHGLGERGPRHPVTGRAACGDETLDEDQLAANRVDFGADVRAHPFVDQYHLDRTPQWERIEVPLLTAGNWGGQGLHLRGNVEGFVRAGSERKWLEIHGLEHWTSYYTDEGREIQRQFFDHVLKGHDNGWAERPPVQLRVRHLDGSFEERWEQAWPIPRTRWTDLHLDLGTATLRSEPPRAPQQLAYDAMSPGLALRSEPFEETTEVTGPVAAELCVSTTAGDADLFLTLRAIGPDGEHRSFVGAIDPHQPATQGWLRLSHRELDPELSTPYRPVHRHTSPAEVTPGVRYDVQVELWPTSLVMPAGSRLELLIGGCDYADDALPPVTMSNFKNRMTGSGPFLHDDPEDRPDSRLAGTVTLHTGEGATCLLRLPVVP